MKLDTDVLVAGAGASGIPAAIQAARQGARVVLLEEDAMPGGAPVDNFVSFLCGGPRNGVYRETVERLNADDDVHGIRVENFDAGIRGEYWYMPSAYIGVSLRMLAEHPNIRLVCGVTADEVLLDDAPARHRVLGVAGRSSSGRRFEVRAKTTIDATGVGRLSELAGCETRYGRDARAEFGESNAPETADGKTMPCTWMYISQRVRPGPPPPTALPTRAGYVDTGLGWANEHPGPCRQRDSGIYLHWGSTVDCADTRDSFALAEAQRAAWEKVQPDVEELRSRGFELHFAPRIGVRECRRVMGEHVITQHDLVEGRFPDDSIATCDYFLDLWGEALISRHVRVLAGIPYRALVPRGVEGLLVAGKCISGTHVALSAYRVQPIVAAVGQAAGAAAALAAELSTGVRDLPVPQVQAHCGFQFP
ncbi:MAG: FAD-dependent oxidoreductase [Kiritimatiellia bacterium]